jgi:hypothetical protein
MPTEIVLSKSGEKLLKVCNGNAIAFSKVIEFLIDRLTMGELLQIFKSLNLEE